MQYVQLVTPAPNIACKPGWCLQYVQRAFRAGWSGSTATQGWKLTKHPHADQKFPSGVAVPVWFSLADEPAGHVAIRMGDGSYYSTSHPTSTTPTHHPNLQHLLKYYGGRLTVRGWSEDLNGTRLITAKEETPMPITREQEQVLSLMATGSVPGKDYNYRFTGLENTQANIDKLLQFWQAQANGAGGLAAQLKSAKAAHTAPVVSRQDALKYINDNLK